MFTWISKSIAAQFIVPMIAPILFVVTAAAWLGLQSHRASCIVHRAPRHYRCGETF
jgi:hypothetical protein